MKHTTTYKTERYVMIMEQNLLQGEKKLKVIWGLTMFLKSYLFDEA